MHEADDKRVHDKEARSLVEAGFEVFHICPSHSQTEEIKVFDKNGVSIHQYAKKSGIPARLKQLIRLFRYARAVDADVYHCNEVDSWLVGIAMKTSSRKKCVFDVHEHYPSTFAESRFPAYLQPVVANLVRLSFRLFLPLTDNIVLAKQTVGDDFRCSTKKKILVQNFTPKSRLPQIAKRPMRGKGTPFTIVHLGLFSKLRGWPQVLEAMSTADRNVHLKIIGKINDGSQEEFETTARELGLEDRIELVDWMPFEEAFDCLLKADVGLIAFQPHIQNHVFAMPHKLFDYMAAGMSVLMPKQAIEVAPIVEKTQCGLLIDPSDPAEISHAIDYLFKNPDTAHEMGLRGRKAVLEQYNWENEAKKLVDLYRKI